MSYQILAINPGSTSTKVAWFCDDKPLWSETIAHDAAETSKYPRAADQYDFRLKAVKDCVASHGSHLEDLSAAIGRGGIIDPLPGGTYRVDEALVARLQTGKPWDHASCLGGRIAYGLAEPLGKPAYIIDPVSVDELCPEARLSGLPQTPRVSLVHALNVKATVRRAAHDLGLDWQKANFVVAHLGGGVTICAHAKGRIIDFDSGNDGGPMSPERAGRLPAIEIVKLCFESGLSQSALKKYLAGGSGIKAWLGTHDVRAIRQMATDGDAKAQLILDAFAYQVACSMGMMAASLSGDVDALLFTGGISHDSELVAAIERRVGWIAPCLIYPGEDEMAALCGGALRVFQGLETARDYRSSVLKRESN